LDKVLTQLVERLQKAYGDRLVSVVLYGSAVAGDHHPHFSDYNVLCVLSEITSRQLGAGEDASTPMSGPPSPKACFTWRAISTIRLFFPPWTPASRKSRPPATPAATSCSIFPRSPASTSPPRRAWARPTWARARAGAASSSKSRSATDRKSTRLNSS